MSVNHYHKLQASAENMRDIITTQPAGSEAQANLIDLYQQLVDYIEFYGYDFAKAEKDFAEFFART